MEKDNLNPGFDFWPSLTMSLVSLSAQIISSQHVSDGMEHQMIIRFKNRYGVKVSQNSLHKNLYSVAVLRFFGRNLENYCLVRNSHIPDVTWYNSSSEVLLRCEQIAQWKNNHAQYETLFQINKAIEGRLK